MNFLEKIVEHKKSEIRDLYQNFSINYFKDKIAASKLESISFLEAFQKRLGLKLIAEVKKASPSKGIIRSDFRPLDLAEAFATAGATALSVLTERDFFLGDPAFITKIKTNVSLPILRKDFIIDPIQIYEAKAIGADAILLIKAILDLKTCQNLINTALSLGLEVLLEIHSFLEFAAIKELQGLNFVGINNRDLKNFEINKNFALELAPAVKDFFGSETFVIAESGYSTIADLENLAQLNIDGVLIGEGLAREPEMLQWFK